MDNFTATEQAYKNGYEQGMKDAVKHGEWEWYISPVCLSGDLYRRCSICGDSDPWQLTTRGCSNYCPNCGAKMDGGEADGQT